MRGAVKTRALSQSPTSRFAERDVQDVFFAFAQNPERDLLSRDRALDKVVL